MKKQIRLSKSRVTEYLQYPRRLYLSIHRPDLRLDSDEMKARFNIGHHVGEIAQGLYPDGIMIGDQTNDLKAALIQTKQIMRDFPDKPIFEATYQYGDMLIRADLLIPENGLYRMIEVKSSTSVKDYYLPDCAMQSWVIENNDIQLSQLSLMNINSDFVYRTYGNYDGLLKETDITELVEPYKSLVPNWIAESQSVVTGLEPQIEIGPQCTSPFECPFFNHCSSGRPEYPVDLLPKNKARGTIDSLIEQGYQDLRDVPEGIIDHPQLEKIRRITHSGKAELDLSVKELISQLPYPRYFLDFETIQFTVPIWIDTSPFEQLPFQWSCHIEQEDGTLEHVEFLDLGGQAPMRQFAESLVESMGSDGPILVYNQGFEKGRIRELASRYEDLAPQLHDIIDRIVDLLPMARDYYYHPDMKGSWSIKAVLPTVAPELNYQDLDEVQHGGAAQDAYLEAIAENTDVDRREKLRKSLIEYCKLDTMAMVKLARFFEGKS